jgi:hypothetical protein
MLINRAEIHRAPETPNPSALTIVEGSPERELCVPIKQTQTRRIRPPAIPQKRRPPKDSPSPSIPPTIRAEMLNHWPTLIKARLPPRSRLSLSFTLNVSILFMVFPLFFGTVNTLPDNLIIYRFRVYNTRYFHFGQICNFKI